MVMRLFEEESEDVYDVRHCILGHIQQVCFVGSFIATLSSSTVPSEVRCQGGIPTARDRIIATRLVAPVVPFLETLPRVGSAYCADNQSPLTSPPHAL